MTPGKGGRQRDQVSLHDPASPACRGPVIAKGQDDLAGDGGLDPCCDGRFAGAAAVVPAGVTRLRSGTAGGARNPVPAGGARIPDPAGSASTLVPASAGQDPGRRRARRVWPAAIHAADGVVVNLTAVVSPCDPATSTIAVIVVASPRPPACRAPCRRRARRGHRGRAGAGRHGLACLGGRNDQRERRERGQDRDTLDAEHGEQGRLRTAEGEPCEREGTPHGRRHAHQRANRPQHGIARKLARSFCGDRRHPAHPEQIDDRHRGDGDDGESPGPDDGPACDSRGHSAVDGAFGGRSTHRGQPAKAERAAPRVRPGGFRAGGSLTCRRHRRQHEPVGTVICRVWRYRATWRGLGCPARDVGRQPARGRQGQQPAEHREQAARAVAGRSAAEPGRRADRQQDRDPGK